MPNQALENLLIIVMLIMVSSAILTLAGFVMMVYAAMRRKDPDDPRPIPGMKPFFIGLLGFLIGFGVCFVGLSR